jgi:hypothetical protein
MTGATPAQTTAVHPPEAAILMLLKTTPKLGGSIVYNLYPDAPSLAIFIFDLFKDMDPISDAVIKADNILVPPMANDMFGFYGGDGYKQVSVSIGHSSTISVTANGTTYTGSGGTIDSFPQLVKPADGATISMKETPLLNLQWTGAGGIVPVWLNVTFRGGGKSIELYNSEVYTDHMQVHLLRPHNSIPQGSTGLITVSLTKECSHVIMDGMMRFTSTPHVQVHKNFYLQLVL